MQLVNMILMCNSNIGIARKLVENVVERAKREKLTSFLFKSGNLNSKLQEKILKFGADWYRNDQRDWSVYRLSF